LLVVGGAAVPEDPDAASLLPELAPKYLASKAFGDRTLSVNDDVAFAIISDNCSAPGPQRLFRAFNRQFACWPAVHAASCPEDARERQRRRPRSSLR
jgi:hypothetical protein